MPVPFHILTQSVSQSVRDEYLRQWGGWWWYGVQSLHTPRLLPANTFLITDLPGGYMPVAFLSICRALLTQMDYHLYMTDAIFLPLTRAWGGEGYDEAVGGRPSRNLSRACVYKN